MIKDEEKFNIYKSSILNKCHGCDSDEHNFKYCFLVHYIPNKLCLILKN